MVKTKKFMDHPITIIMVCIIIVIVFVLLDKFGIIHRPNKHL
jgi:hypothetical protein